MACSVACMSYCIMRYYSFLLELKEDELGNKKAVVFIISVLNGAIMLAPMIYMSEVHTILFICILISAEYRIMLRNKGRALDGIVYFLATTMNFSCAYCMVYSLCRIIEIIPWDGAGFHFRILVGIVSCCVATCLVEYLHYSGLFPNDLLRKLFKDQKRVIPLIGYLFLFSIGNIFTLTLLIPTLSDLTLERIQAVNSFLEVFIKAGISLIGAYLIVRYLCKTIMAEEEIASITLNYKREHAYRKNQISSDAVSYCIDIDNDSFVEGGQQFDYMFEGREASYYEAFSETNKRFVHPDDLKVLEPYLKKETIIPLMADTPNREESVRISRNAFDLVIEAEKDKNTDAEKAHEVLRQLSDVKSNDEWFWVCADYTLTHDDITNKNYLYISISNINDKKSEELLLRQNAERDALTGLYNRAYFEKKIEVLLNTYAQGSLYMIDADHLKAVNDKLGHAAGDHMLQNIGDIIQSEFRNEDVVARLGGDEFIVFSSGLDNISTIKQRAGRLNERSRQEYTAPDGTVIRTSISIGVAFYPMHGETAAELMECADKALYYVKKYNRDSFMVYSLEME